MNTVLRITFVSIFGLLLSSCGTNKTAAEALTENDFRNNVYREIVNDQSKFMEFMEVAHANPPADMWLLKDHMQMMENGKIQEIMKNNPEMKEQMQKMKQEKMEKAPKMQQKMQKKMKNKMMNNPEMRMAMMQEMHQKMKSNPQMADKMMDQMIQFLHENPELMEKMKAKMKAHQDKM
ncbi:hypothetical protein [Salegentibacter salarius]|uniref:DUF4175 domain-containing protein n=1 Tax=Salegentibacter salarius TaxID=435906 RepID=A0A2N0TWR0_9FLAO|nr:hypothetical protein [Salegentibacter salarius]OEY72767.1 hypothetical protein BHS39_11580 [Salegentibacter salarius]PKD19161.1 hypothetical protein APR40_11560 [Salegentibacter salarius]SLK00454.1 hypothetical protein SAMN05660445_02365 [Salegentibacter salarius]